MRTHVCTHVYNNIHIWCIFSSIFFCTHLVSKINPIPLCHLSNLIYFLCITIPLIFNFSPIIYIYSTPRYTCVHMYTYVSAPTLIRVYIYIFSIYIYIYKMYIYIYIYVCVYICRYTYRKYSNNGRLNISYLEEMIDLHSATTELDSRYIYAKACLP